MRHKPLPRPRRSEKPLAMRAKTEHVESVVELSHVGFLANPCEHGLQGKPTGQAALAQQDMSDQWSQPTETEHRIDVRERVLLLEEMSNDP